MLSKEHFYWDMTRKYVIAFSHIIDDIHVIRTDSNNVAVKDITVPITYAAKSKLFYHLLRKNSKRVSRTTLPRISYIFSKISFDSTRKLNNLNTCSFETESGTETFQYIGIPYNFEIEMSIWTIYMDDLLQIIEQMATFFTPDFSMDVVEIEEFGLTKSVPVILNDISFDFENEFEDTDRILKADASFTLKGYFYPAISDASIIKHINVQFNDRDTEETLETLKVDWDNLNQRIVTSIETGKTFFEFNSEVDITSATIGAVSI